MTSCETAFREAMSRCASATWIIAAADEEERAGMTATAVMALTAEPPRVAIAVNRTNMSHDLIARSRRFSLNLVSEEQCAIALIFAGADPAIRGDAKFTHGDWTVRNGLMHLAGALATLRCRVDATNQVGTHTLFIATVEDVGIDRDINPAIYYRRSFSYLMATGT